MRTKFVSKVFVPFLQTNPDDEEDIFSINSRELQIKRQDSTGANVTIVKHEIPNGIQTSISEAAGSSDSQPNAQNWETFDEEDTENSHGYQKINDNSEPFDETADTQSDGKRRNWEKFENDEDNIIPKIKNNVRLKNSFADVKDSTNISNATQGPTPLFTDTPVNNNTTYSYDVLEQDPEVSRQPAVFMPPNIESKSRFSSLELLGQPTFYKSLLTVMTTKFSTFIFYTLFPVYLYEELQGLKIREMSTLMGILSISNLMFSGVSYWVNIDKKRRPICMWILCWIGSFGYFSKLFSNYYIFTSICDFHQPVARVNRRCLE